MTYREYNKAAKSISMDYNPTIKRLQELKKKELRELEKKYVEENRKYKNGEVFNICNVWGDAATVSIQTAFLGCGGEIYYVFNETGRCTMSESGLTFQIGMGKIKISTL